jgi:hypothetical protein
LCKKQSDSTKKFSEADIINMLELLIDNIFAMFDGRVFQQTVGIHMGTNCRPLLAGMLQHKNGKFTMGKLKSFICRKISFLTSPFQGMKQIYLYLWHPLFQPQWDRCSFHSKLKDI